MTIHTHEEGNHRSQRVRIPANVDQPDRILMGLTGRQLGILATTALALWIAYTATAEAVPLAAFLAVAIPVAVAAVTLALGRRDGLGLDQLLLAALRHLRTPRRRVPAPEGILPPPSWAGGDRTMLPAPLRLPAHAVGPDGVIDLGEDGTAVLVACSSMNFALRTAREKAALVAAFGRYLNSLSSPVQVVVRARRVDLGPLASRLRRDAPALAHPALEAAAREHADFLADLAGRRELLSRQVLLVVREPRPSGPRASDAGTARAVLRHGDEAVRALAAAGITATVLDDTRTAAVLAHAATPTRADQSAGHAPPSALISTKGPR